LTGSVDEKEDESLNNKSENEDGYILLKKKVRKDIT